MDLSRSGSVHPPRDRCQAVEMVAGALELIKVQQTILNVRQEHCKKQAGDQPATRAKPKSETRVA